MIDKYRLFPVILACVLIGTSPVYSKGLLTTTPEEVGLSSERLERVDDVMQKYVDSEHVAGLSITIARQGKTAYRKTFGLMDIEANKPMAEDTIFRIASMTKAITSVGIMMLAEEGSLRLNEPLSKYVPGFKESMVLVPAEGDNPDPPYTLEPAKSQITIRHLLAHTSGISYRFMGRKHIAGLYKEAKISDGLVQTDGVIGDMVDRLAELPLHNHPGESWEYGLNTDVLGRLIEIVSGEPLDQFFEKRIFVPLGMNDTHFFLPEDKVDRLAAVYAPKKEGGIARLPDDPVDWGNLVYSQTYPYDGPKTHFSGGGGLSSTANDYLRFLQMLLNGGELDGVRLLSPKTIELMTSNHIGDLSVGFGLVGYKFGLGFALHVDPGASGLFGSAGDYGWGGFFYTRFWVDPEEQLIGLMMAQIFPNRHLDILQKFRALTYQSIVE